MISPDELELVLVGVLALTVLLYALLSIVVVTMAFIFLLRYLRSMTLPQELWGRRLLAKTPRQYQIMAQADADARERKRAPTPPPTGSMAEDDAELNAPPGEDATMGDLGGEPASTLPPLDETLPPTDVEPDELVE